MQLLILQAIDSSTGPGESLRDALWETGNTINQTHVLWYDPVPKWAPGVAYHWRLQHKPDSGRIRLRWYQVSFIKSTIWLQLTYIYVIHRPWSVCIGENCTRDREHSFSQYGPTKASEQHFYLFLNSKL